MRVKLKITLLMVLTLAACGNHHDSQIRDTSRTLKYVGSNSGSDCEDAVAHGDCEVTLKFRDMVTNETFKDETLAGTALHRLGWLNRDKCYTLPLDEDQHKEVPCG